MHVYSYKAQIPANKDQNIVNIVSPGNAFLAIPGNKCPNSEIARYGLYSDIFKQCQMLVYLIALCTSAVCIKHTGIVYTCIYYPGNRKH